ncbi:VUT family protein [Parashewanella curva]|uniref:Queuosine precursor transporter n=1 Tax=Parashewanella curva TaxID=2338552 RepID=A0A3L8PW21_9GAMM|nr:queuosine precursor transporter [Parashewanella curva]RLV58252.1 VUT family protein [Parashewanella curva]
MWEENELKTSWELPNAKLLALLATYIVLLCLTVCFANNITSMMGMTLPGGIYVFPVSFIICDIVSEVYGFPIARLFIWFGMISELIFAFLSQALIAIPHPDTFIHAQAYHTVFSPTVRYVFSGMVGFFSGEFLNVYILSKWKIRVKGRYFVIRSVMTTAIGQAVLSIVVDYLAFAGKMPTSELISMMYAGWKVKMIYSLFFVLPAWYIVSYIKKTDKIDVYDVNTNFNPFRFKLS